MLFVLAYSITYDAFACAWVWASNGQVCACVLVACMYVSMHVCMHVCMHVLVACIGCLHPTGLLCLSGYSCFKRMARTILVCCVCIFYCICFVDGALGSWISVAFDWQHFCGHGTTRTSPCIKNGACTTASFATLILSPAHTGAWIKPIVTQQVMRVPSILFSFLHPQALKHLF